MTFSNILTWLLRLLVAALFLFTGYHKLAGDPMMIQVFATIGWGDWFRYVTGILEVAAALGVLWPATTPWGAALGVGIGIGAFLTQVIYLHEDWIHTVVIVLVCAALFYLTRSRVGAFLGKSAA